MHAIIDTQVRQAETAMMVVHRSDFEHNGQRLNRGGLLRLKQISKLLPTNTSRVIVQRTKGNSELDERRRQTVIKYLSDNAVAVPAERIVFGEPRVRGFDGIDAEAAHERMLQLNGAAGTTSTVGSTSAQGKSSPKPGK